MNSRLAGREKEITVGGKDFTEQLILVNLYSDYIEAHTDIHCVRKENLGGSQVCYQALKKGRYRYVRGLYRHPVRKRAEA